jgi:hypothetical protein
MFKAVYYIIGDNNPGAVSWTYNPSNPRLCIPVSSRNLINLITAT